MSVHTDRRPPWDALALVSFDTGAATDRSSYARTPTVSSGATFTTRVADFDGTSSAEITYPDSTNFESAPFTVCFWVRLDSAISARVNLVGHTDNSGVYPGWYIHWSPTSNLGYVFATISNAFSNYKVIYSNSAGAANDNDGVWRHIAVTCSDINSYGTFYLNGAAQTMTQAGAGTVTTIASSRPLTIGGLNGSNAHTSRLNGAIDDLRIFSRALTAAEIAGIYNSTSGITRP